MTGQRNRPVGDRAAQSRFAGDAASLRDASDSPRAAHARITPETLPSDYLERITLRQLQDVLAGATRDYWLRRAEILEDARPRPDDWPGRPPASWAEAMERADRRQALDDRLALMAEQCRVHAGLFTHDDIDADLIREVLGWPLPTEGVA